LFAKIIARVPTVVAFRIGSVFSVLLDRYYAKESLVPFLVRRFFKKTDVVIANSKGVADDLCRMTGIERNKVKVIFNPKKIDDILKKSKEPIAEGIIMSDKLPQIVAVGRLRILKNFPLLIQAFAKVAKNIPARLVIVGGGKPEDLQELAHTLGVEDLISFTGHTDNPHAYVSRADVFVSTSLLEGLPNSLLEAMICSVPIISSDCNAGPREILAPDTDHGKRLEKGIEYAKYGVLTAINDEAALVEALTKMLSDPAMRARYASLSKERRVDFEFDKILDEYEKALGISEDK